MQSRWSELLAEAEHTVDDAVSMKREQWRAALETMQEEYDRLVLDGKGICWISWHPKGACDRRICGCSCWLGELQIPPFVRDDNSSEPPD
jgi:hypothetical protein